LAPPQPTRRVRPSTAMTVKARTGTKGYRRKKGVKVRCQLADNIQ
jgi:hypothetical protein